MSIAMFSWCQSHQNIDILALQGTNKAANIDILAPQGTNKAAKQVSWCHIAQCWGVKGGGVVVPGQQLSS